MTRSLLLKGLAGVAALGGTVGGLAFYRKEIFGGWGKGQEEPKSEDVSKFSQKELIDKVGLDCKLGEETEIKDSETKDCSVKTEGTIKVKIGDKEEEGVTFTGNGSKLKVSKSEELGSDGTDKYNKKLKFVVDSGDISLNKTGGSSSIPKLEQFETYEVFLRDKKFYLRRKTDAKEEKIKALGLPTGKDKCSLPESGDSDCTLTIEEAKKVKFENHTGGVTISTGEVRLKISKIEDKTSFPDGYRFTFTFPSEVTINTKKIKANTPYDFKIKKGTGNALSLEKAWESDDAFTKKAGLKCEGSNNECTVPADSQNLNVKVGDKTKEGISSISTGKIKMETEQEGYNQGLKFTITTADISISSVAGEGISKLEELETYEITEEGGKYYLTRKTSKEESIRSSLVLPKGCDLPTTNKNPVECDLSTEDFKKINFKDKSSPTSTGTVKLKISKANSTDFPLGYKFTFNTTTEATIKNSEIKIKANIPTDFKIKKNDSNPASISLEKAWSDTNYSFAAKVGLDCSSSDGCCTKSSSPSPDINVKRGNETKTGITSFGTSDSGKIKVEKDQAGYNQGLKFTITGGNVTLTGGNGGTFTQLDEYETYEITEEGDKYYLTRKTEASKTIGDLLGLTDAGCSISTTSCTLSTEQIKKVKFDGKDATGPTASANATLKITSGANTTDFPLGYKFTLQSQQEITIKTGEKVAANISTDFKIKKAESGQTPALSLEKAWTAESLGKKVGLNCTSASGGDECCSMASGSSEKLNVKQGSDKKDGITSFSGGKIKVEKDQAGYNQGLKFTISDADATLTGGNKVGSSSPDITKLGEYETYEIKEEGGKWYLSRKHESIVFLKKALGFEFCSDDTLGGIFTCEIEKVDDLKKIKFNNKGSFSSWPTDPISIELSIEKETNGEGLKFTFNKKNKTDSQGNTVSSVNTSSTLCIPDGAGGSIDLKSSSNTVGAIYKIKKSTTGGSTTLCLEKKSNSGSSGTCAK